jgi:Predicted nucleotide-binding protein containing TIR-like domain
MKPRVFIGSSTQGLEVAENLNIRLAKDCETVPWNGGTFQISDTYIESLEKALADVEFAVLVVTPDDLRIKAGESGKVPRDNVVFELGLFMGRLGRERTFIVSDPNTVQLPTDLKGIATAEFDSQRSDGNLRSAVLPAATEILHAIRQVPRLAKTAPAKTLNRVLGDTDALYNAIVSWPAGEAYEVVIQTADTTWAWKLVPSLIHWRLNRTRVRVFAPPVFAQNSTTRAERARRALLEDLGCDVRECSDLAISGFFLRAKYWDESVAIIVNDRPSTTLPLATKYEGIADAAAVEALFGRLTGATADVDPTDLFMPSIAMQDIGEVMNLLRSGVRQYRSAKVTMSEARVATKDLLPLSTYARAYKYVQIERLFSVYRGISQEPFTALAITLKSGKKSILTPPVVEVREESSVVIEGTTRATFCFRNQIDDYYCIAVHGVEEDLPGVPLEIGKVTISERSLSQNERTEDFQASLYRQIERATHPY